MIFFISYQITNISQALDWDLDVAVTMHMEQDNFSDAINSADTESVNAAMGAVHQYDNNMGMNVTGQRMGMGMGMGMGGINIGGRNDFIPNYPPFSYPPSGLIPVGQTNFNSRVDTNTATNLNMNVNMNIGQNNYYQSEDDDEYGDYTGGPSDYRMGDARGMGPNGPGGSSWAMASGAGARSGKADQYDDEGVRLPDQIISERMLGGHSNFEPLGRADSAEVTWLFPPPRHLSFPGSLQEVIYVSSDIIVCQIAAVLIIDMIGCLIRIRLSRNHDNLQFKILFSRHALWQKMIRSGF